MEKRVALVTGSSRGIGRAIALALGEAGFNVIVNCVKRIDLAEETADMICRAGGRADFIRADVGSVRDVETLYRFVRSNFGFADTIINNAGVSHYSLFTDDSTADFDKVMNVNLRGVFNVCRAFVPDMIDHKFGRIINISSMWGIVGASCEALYSASKAGVIGLTKALSKELGPSGITVNAVAPGVINTDMLSSVSRQTIKELAEDTPACRCGEPQDVASAVKFLASEEAGFITGDVLNCSGGFIM